MAIQRGGGKPKQPKKPAPKPEAEGEGGGEKPKFKLPKIDFTSKMAGQTMGTIVCVVIGAFFLYLSVVRGCTGYHVTSSLEAYEANQASAAQKHAESALWWSGGHLGSRILKAKLLCDAGSDKTLQEAYQAYLDLANDGYDDEPQVMAGWGVVVLKLADRAPVSEADARIAEARQLFQAAGGIPEAHIGLGHCDLIHARKHNDAKMLASARAKFLAIRKIMQSDPEFRAQCTRDGLIDYYSGLGKALALGGAFDPSSVKALKACSQLSDRWIMPRANLLRLEAVRLGQVEIELGETKKLKEEGLELMSRFRQTAVAKDEDKAIMEDARLIYMLGLASALGRAGDFRGYDELRGRAVSAYPRRMEPFIFDAAHQTERAEVGHSDMIEMGKLVNSASRAYRALLPKLNEEDAGQKDAKARILNNGARMDVWNGDIKKGVARYYREAHGRLMAAVKLAPNDYVINRNLIVASLRMGHRPEVYAPYVAKARELAQGPWAADFAQVEKAMASE